MTESLRPHRYLCFRTSPIRIVAEALAWLSKTFGFTEHYRYGTTAQRRAGFILGSA